MATIKKGTYWFNDVLNIGINHTEPLVFNCNDVSYSAIVLVISTTDDVQTGEVMGFVTDTDGVQAYANGRDFGDVGWQNEAYKTITIPTDSEVSDEFGVWYAANTKPLAVEITYKDKVINLFAGQTARLHNADGSNFGFTEDLVVRANEVEMPETTDSPLPIEVATESEMNSLLTTAEVGAVYKYTGTSGTYESGALYVIEESE